jgi:hypothetical protein
MMMINVLPMNVYLRTVANILPLAAMIIMLVLMKNAKPIPDVSILLFLAMMKTLVLTILVALKPDALMNGE